MNCIYRYFCLVILFFRFAATAQNEAINWYFGVNAGLSFSTNPPTVLTNGALATEEGCATISDPTGNLLFYTDGSTVWNALHVPMANGTGLFGNWSTTQSAIIVGQPGSAIIYHIFTLSSINNDTLSYSTVDMSLASGSGSVVAKNVFLSSGMTEKMTSARHCNGTDQWVITHEGNSNNFKTYLVAAGGVSTTPVVSPSGPINLGLFGSGTMKSSPNGRLIANARNGSPQSGSPTTDIFKFDQNTGQVTFQYSLNTGLSSYGCEFSPDGTKLYVSGTNGSLNNLSQFDICAGSPTAVAASVYSMLCTVNIGAMQSAPNGKLYCARRTKQTLGVINNPNLGGSLCNFIELGLSIAPNISLLGLPNFAIAYKPTTVPFTHTMISCSTASFNAPPSAQTFTAIGCNPSGYSVTGMQWNFGDTASGAGNTSTLVNPQHVFTSPGTYTTTFILNLDCGGRNDTLKQVIAVGNSIPSPSVAGIFNICEGDQHVYSVTGAHTYSWNTNATTQTVALNPTTTMGYTVTGTDTISACSASITFTITVDLCTGVKDLKESASRLNIYPNPVDKLLCVENLLKIRILLLNQQGLVLKEEIFEPGLNTFDIRIYEDGAYFLRVIDKTGVTTKRLMKMN